ncbi:MerR family transcriptional regulator [Dyella flagellata]|uniref:MerR family transcriptional regulator n=1 Tax=Dyella flagellata TaxID=1867833 RepID=A0ABQ5XDG7_9GAMM|nr:MerR family transcriptional regulator [Dyella flagellata]GLQ89266.1 MerR family transcriptional regulator [Dyella flagellata]
MRWKVGELARRTGLTVRSLHHYHQIGLLCPSARSDAGYRLYTAEDVERLYRIIALRQLGLSLDDIGAALSSPEAALPTLIAKQIQMLELTMARDHRLHRQLCAVRDTLEAGQSLDPSKWIDTMELMTMYEQHFSAEELKRLPLYQNADARSEWSALVEAVQAAIDRGAKPGDADVDLLAFRWMQMIHRDTGGNPDFLMRLHTMNQEDPQARQRTGITKELGSFVEQAIVTARLAIFERYLHPDEMVRMRENYGRNMYEWPPLIAALVKARDLGVPASDPHVRELVSKWLELFTAYAGNDPATHARIREAYAKEPDLRSGSGVDENLFAYMRAVMEELAQQARPT